MKIEIDLKDLKFLLNLTDNVEMLETMKDEDVSKFIKLKFKLGSQLASYYTELERGKNGKIMQGE